MVSLVDGTVWLIEASRPTAGHIRPKNQPIKINLLVASGIIKWKEFISKKKKKNSKYLNIMINIDLTWSWNFSILIQFVNFSFEKEEKSMYLNIETNVLYK